MDDSFKSDSDAEKREGDKSVDLSNHSENMELQQTAAKSENASKKDEAKSLPLPKFERRLSLKR